MIFDITNSHDITVVVFKSSDLKSEKDKEDVSLLAYAICANNCFEP